MKYIIIIDNLNMIKKKKLRNKQKLKNNKNEIYLFFFILIIKWNHYLNNKLRIIQRLNK